MKLCLTVMLCMGLSVAGLVVARERVAPSYLQPSNDICGGYLQTVGTIYAVLLAFVVFVVWTQANDARRLVERQADELADVIRLTYSIHPAAGASLCEAMKEYVHEVVANEWRTLAIGRSSPKACELLERTWKVLAAIAPATPREEALLGEAMSRFSEAGDARADLLHCSRVRLPILLWLLLLSGAAGTVGSMYLFGSEQFWPLATMTASLAGAVSFMLFLIRDLDNPFQGDWRVVPDPILAAVVQAETLAIMA